MLSWLDCIEEYVLSKDKQGFVLKDSVSKGMTLLTNLSSLNASYTYHLFHPRIQIQLTKNGNLPNKTKMTN